MHTSLKSSDWRTLASIHLALTDRLATLGVRITDTPLPCQDVARWDPTNATLHIRPGDLDDLDDLEDRVWVLWDFLRVHIHGLACADARPATRLALVS